MLAFLNLGLTEMLLILVVAILVFGRNLPTVAVQAAATVQKMRRSLVDLRREAGIDEELRRARREFEQAVPRDLPRLVERKLDSITADPEPRREPRTTGADASPAAPAVPATPQTTTTPADAAGRAEPDPAPAAGQEGAAQDVREELRSEGPDDGPDGARTSRH